MLPGRDREDLWLCESLHRRASLALKGLEEGNGKKEDMYKILSRVDYSDDVFMQVIEAPAVAAACQPGQFIILMIHEEGERIPLTIADFDREAGNITIVVQAIGTSTRHLQTLGKGDSLSSFIGPLGQPSEIEKVGTVVCAAGGVGVAPIYPIARALKEAGNKVICIMAARNESLLFWEDKMREVSDELIVTTDGGCRVSVGGETKFVCVDGPEFDGHQVDFDLLMSRQRQYLKQEKESLDAYL